MHTCRIVTGTALLAAIVLGGCVKVRTLDDPSSAEAVRPADDAPVPIYAATNPFELAEVRSTSSHLLDETETVGHLVVMRSIVGWALRADDEHIIDVAKKRARRMGGDSIVVLSWDALDARRVDVASLPVPIPFDDRERPPLGPMLLLAASDLIALSARGTDALVSSYVSDPARPFWLFGRPPVSMTARVLRSEPVEGR